MALWQIFSIIGFAFLIFEMLTPSYFCLNFGIAAFITAAISVWISDWIILTIVFAVLSRLQRRGNRKVIRSLQKYNLPQTEKSIAFAAKRNGGVRE